MEPLTQALTALTVSRLAWPRMQGTLVLLFLIAAVAPDVDLLTSVLGANAYLRFHRTILHSIPSAILLALVIAAFGCLLERWVRARRPESSATRLGHLRYMKAVAICCCGLGIHILLDLCDPVGVQLLWPLGLRWWHWDLAATLDPWILSALVVGLALGALLKITSEEIGDASNSHVWPRRCAIVAMVALAAYFTARSALHARAIQMLGTHNYSDELPQALAAFPSPVSPFDWRGVVSTQNFLNEIDVPLRPPGAFDPGNAVPHFKPEPSAALQHALETPEAKSFLRYAKFSMANVQVGEQATVVQLRDLRFSQGLRSANNLILVVELDSQLNVMNEEAEYAHARH